MKKHERKPRAGVFIVGWRWSGNCVMGFIKSLHHISPCATQNPRVFLCSKTYHKVNKYADTKITACIFIRYEYYIMIYSS